MNEEAVFNEGDEVFWYDHGRARLCRGTVEAPVPRIEPVVDFSVPSGHSRQRTGTDYDIVTKTKTGRTIRRRVYSGILSTDPSGPVAMALYNSQIWPVVTLDELISACRSIDEKGYLK